MSTNTERRASYRLIGKHRTDMNAQGMWNFYSETDDKQGDNRAAFIHSSFEVALAQVIRVLKRYPGEFVSIQQLVITSTEAWESTEYTE